jgi:peptidoglycan/LPS O-acetylase OafA/YrhL
MSSADGPTHVRSDSSVPAAAALAPPAAAPLHTVSATHTSRFKPDAYVAGIVGLVFVLLSGPMSLPVVKVLGWTHTTTLGLIEVALGLVLMAAAGSRSRSGELFGGLLLGVGGFVGLVQHRSFVRTLALENPLAWAALLCGIVVVLLALLMPRFSHRSSSVDTR